MGAQSNLIEPWTIVYGFQPESEIFDPGKRRIPTETASKEDQNGTNISSVAPSSEEIWVRKDIKSKLYMVYVSSIRFGHNRTCKGHLVCVPNNNNSLSMICYVMIVCSPQEDGVLIEYCAWECYAQSPPFIWLALEYVYLIILQVVALILAFMTRKVKIKALNDAKFVVAIIYVTSIVMVALIIITFALDSFVVVTEILFSGGIMLATTVFISFIFVPKVKLGLYFVSTYTVGLILTWSCYRCMPCTKTLKVKECLRIALARSPQI